MLCLETPYGKGYADLHPWPTLGDSPWEDQLEECRKGSLSQQLHISLSMAEDDARARYQKQPALGTESIVTNHTLFLDAQLTLSSLREAFPFSQKPTLAKWKVNPETLPHHFDFLLSASEEFPFLRWRLDANSTLDQDELLSFWKRLPQKTKTLIDYIEDPCRYTLAGWQRLMDEGIPLALDFEWKNWWPSSEATKPPPTLPKGSLTFILKPAVQNFCLWEDWFVEKANPIVFTSYLDHPLGLVHGLWRVQTFMEKHPDLVRTCGFNLALNKGQLQELGFSMYQGSDNEKIWRGFSGAGIGNKNYLESRPWTPLITD